MGVEQAGESASIGVPGTEGDTSGEKAKAGWPLFRGDGTIEDEELPKVIHEALVPDFGRGVLNDRVRPAVVRLDEDDILDSPLSKRWRVRSFGATSVVGVVSCWRLCCKVCWGWWVTCEKYPSTAVPAVAVESESPAMVATVKLIERCRRYE